MKLFYQLKLDAILLPAIALLICLGGWAIIAGHGKTTVSVDDWGDKVTKTERFGLSKNLPSPAETWIASKPYIMEPFAKRGELDQGILRFAWLSLKLVAQGYAIALILGTPSASSSVYLKTLPAHSIPSSRSSGPFPRSHGYR